MWVFFLYAGIYVILCYIHFPLCTKVNHMVLNKYHMLNLQYYPYLLYIVNLVL